LQEIDTLIQLLERLKEQEQTRPQLSFSAEQYEMIREAHRLQQKERLESQMRQEQIEDELQDNRLQPIQTIDVVDSKRGGCKLYQQAESIQILLLSDAIQPLIRCNYMLFLHLISKHLASSK